MVLSLVVDESRYKQCGVTPHFSKRQSLLKKILRKDKYWHNRLRKAFFTVQNLLIETLRKNKYWLTID